MILDEADESGRRQSGAWPATPRPVSMGRRLALIGEALGERPPQVLERCLRVIRVVAARFPGGDDMRGVVKIVVPLRAVTARATFLVAPEMARRVVVVLEHEMDMPSIVDPRADRRCDLLKNIRLAVVADGVNGVEAQTVEAILLQPIERVVDH